VKQIQLRRSSRSLGQRPGGPGEPTEDLALPTSPASDTRPAADLLARIDAAISEG
jgi:hypothetical protein